MYALEATNISKSYADHRALDQVSLRVPEGSIFGLLGPNGAGKTSLIRIINQITGPDEGEVRLFGEPLSPKHIAMIGYLPEERGLYRKMKVGEQSMYLAQLKGMSSKDAKKALHDWFDRLEISGWWDKKVEELSKGMAQKIQFVTTVMHNPKLLILDEPFSGFDPINASIIRQEILRLRNEGATVILSTHNMASVEEICNDIALINKSRVVLEGEVEEVRHRFVKNEYQLSFEGNLISFTNNLGARFQLVDHESKEQTHDCVVKINPGSSLNDLLQAVLSDAQIRAVRPRIPSMDEVFIRAVKSETQAS